MASIPPGLQGPLKEVTSGFHPAATDRNWMTFGYAKLFTNVFIWNEGSGKMLLGYKKRGFGKGLYNGFGGKVEPGETDHTAALRELKEEAGVEADLTLTGTILFYTEGYEYAHLIKVFSSTDCKGEPVETEEMRPEWFSIPAEYCLCPSHEDAESQRPPIPFDRMWSDDRLWMPLMLSRRPFAGRVDFAKIEPADDPKIDGEAKMVRWWFGIVE